MNPDVRIYSAVRLHTLIPHGLAFRVSNPEEIDNALSCPSECMKIMERQAAPPMDSGQIDPEARFSHIRIHKSV